MSSPAPTKGVDAILESLYDAYKAKSDIKPLLAEYQRLTGKNRPGFMA